jgi:phage shock protein A
MLLAKPHRRSNRCRSSSAYAKVNKIEKRPGKLYRKNISDEENEDEYADCPKFEGFAYDRDYYLASDKYAKMIDEAIAELKAKTEWEEAMKLYDQCKKDEE